MARVRQTVVGVVICSNFFLHDSTDVGQIDGQCAHVCNLKEPEICDVEEI